MTDSMGTAGALQRGRDLYARREWSGAHAEFAAADNETPLGPQDLERLAAAAYLSGKDAASTATWTRAYHAFLDRGEREGAARCAFWQAFGHLNRGEMAPGAAWLARAQHVLDEGACDCAVRGYLLLPQAIRQVSGDPAGAYETFCQAAEIGARYRDPDLAALACHGRGRALIRLGKTAEGVALLDEAMVAVTAGEVSPIVAGDAYCSVIEGCQEIFDVRRAQEWTSALSAWCASQPELVLYRGQCLVRRAELLQLHGGWAEAMDEAQRACEHLSQPPQPALGAAFYQRAELHRVRGEFEEAEAAYRRASESGRKPQPGLSQLRLAQGQVATAAAAIRIALEEARDRRIRSRLLGPGVEIMIAAGALAEARAAADELVEIAGGIGVPFLMAAAAHARGAVLLAEGNARGACVALREASAVWSELDAPYEAARTRLLTGLACRQLHDEDGAGLELEGARHAFSQLGAMADLTRVEELCRAARSTKTAGLSAREVEVLRLLATGKTNRAIADALCISEKTVARHVSNIFNKLDVSSRAAATAYAYRHRLV